MTVTPLGDFVSAVLARQSAPLTPQSASAALTASVASATVQPKSDVSPSSASGALSQTTDLHNTSVGLTQLSSLLQEAQSGTQQIGSVLQQLQNLAGQAENGGPPSALAALDAEFQQLLTQLNQISASTSFGGANLLDGTFSDQAGTNGNTVSSSLAIPNLSVSGLFGNTPPDVLNVGNASSASAAITNAQNVVNGTSGDITTTQAQVNFAAANVDSALANNDAATAVLSEGDLAIGATGDLLSGLLNNPANTASAQTSNLPTTLLGLLQE
jgi:flagellin